MAVKLKGKQWFPIIASNFFGGKKIGQTPANSPENLIGRRIDLNAVELTNDLNKYYIKLHFRITSVNGAAIAEFDGFECLQDYISRMVLRRIKRIDSIQDLKTTDGVMLRVKGLTIISKKATSNVERKIREFVSKIIKEEVEKSTLEKFLEKVLSNEIKNKIIKQGRVIYPIRNFEIRKTEVLKNSSDQRNAKNI